MLHALRSRRKLESNSLTFFFLDHDLLDKINSQATRSWEVCAHFNGEELMNCVFALKFRTELMHGQLVLLLLSLHLFNLLIKL